MTTMCKERSEMNGWLLKTEIKCQFGWIGFFYSECLIFSYVYFRFVLLACIFHVGIAANSREYGLIRKNVRVTISEKGKE